MQEFQGLGGVQKNSFIDFPGTVSAVLFYNGCNLACPYCHNPSLVRGDVTEALNAEALLAYLTKRRGHIEGVVISGGEPTLHDSLSSLVAFLRHDLGYKVKVDSNGLFPEALAPLNLDYLALDVKTTPERYVSLLGAPYTSQEVENRLKQSLDLLRHGQRGEVRITCAPGVVDEEVIRWMGPFLSGIDQIFLQRFHPTRKLLDEYFFTDREELLLPELARYQAILAPHVGSCKIR